MRLLVGLAVLMGSMCAHGAATNDGNSLLSGCNQAIAILDDKPATDSFGAGRCLGTLEGATGAHYVLESSLADNMKICFPAGYTHAQGIRVVVKYLNDHPEKLNMRGEILVMFALKTAFSCK